MQVQSFPYMIHTSDGYASLRIFPNQALADLVEDLDQEGYCNEGAGDILTTADSVDYTWQDVFDCYEVKDIKASEYYQAAYEACHATI